MKPGRVSVRWFLQGIAEWVEFLGMVLSLGVQKRGLSTGFVIGKCPHKSLLVIR